MYEICFRSERCYPRQKEIEYQSQDFEQFGTFTTVQVNKATSYKDYLANKGPFGETGVEELFSSARGYFQKG